MSEKCKNTDCDFWDDLFEDNCGGEIGGESASATCDRKGKPSYATLARENAELRAALERIVKADDELWSKESKSSFNACANVHDEIEAAGELLAGKGA